MSCLLDTPSASSIPTLERPLPCVFLLDCSSSMRDDIGSVNQELARCYEEIASNDLVCSRLEMLIIPFNSSIDRTCQWQKARGQAAPHLIAAGGTEMALAISYACESIGSRVQWHKANGTPSHYAPYLFLITDGAPTSSQTDWQQGLSDLTALARMMSMNFFFLGTESADFSNLEVLRKAADCGKSQGHAHVAKLIGQSWDDLFRLVTTLLSSSALSGTPGTAIEPTLPATVRFVS